MYGFIALFFSFLVYSALRMNKNILFFSVNRHQKQYFDSLLSAVNENDNGTSLHKRQLLSVMPSFLFDKTDISIIKETNYIRQRYFENKTGRETNIIFRLLYVFSSILFLLKIKKLLATNKFDIIVLWNDMKWHQLIIKKLATKSGIKTAFFENGTLPNTVTFDKKGVNYNNSIPKNREFYLERASDKEISTAPAILKFSNTKEGYVFVPFQVDYDTQIISHSPWVKNMDEFYYALQQIVRTLPNNITIYVKEHPASARCYKHLHNKDKRIEFKNDVATDVLMDDAELVITINSTVGLESIIKNKPVIVLGNAFYCIDGICQYAKSVQELIQKVQTASYPNQIVLKKFISYLSNQYYIPGNWRKPTKEHIASIKSRLYEYL